MAATIITKEDLLEFKEDLLNEIRDIIQPAAKAANSEGRQWLKSWEVKKMLGISNGTLQTMRIKGTISFTKMGGLMFYSYEDILKLMKPTKGSVSKSVIYRKHQPSNL